LLTEYIPLAPNFDAPNFRFGSPRAAAFGLDCGTWVETCLTEHLHGPRFDSDSEVREARDRNANMDLYRTVLGPRLGLANLALVTIEHAIRVAPFEDFRQNENPNWFRKYSSQKHRRIELAENWTMRDSLECIGALTLLLREFVEVGTFINDVSRVFASVFLPSGS